MKRNPKRSLSHHRCPNSCLYFLAEETDSEHDNCDKMYDLNTNVVTNVVAKARK